MEKKKILPLQIISLILLAAGLVCYAFVSINRSTDISLRSQSVLSVLFTVSSVIALLAGVVYVLQGFKKDVAGLYKGFIWLSVASAFFGAVVCMSFGFPVLSSFLVLADLILLTILAVGKDLGKIKTHIIAIVIVVIRAATVVSIITNQEMNTMTALCNTLGQLIVSVVILLLAIGKYIDKAARGTK